MSEEKPGVFPEENDDYFFNEDRRSFLKKSVVAAGIGVSAPGWLDESGLPFENKTENSTEFIPITLSVNGKKHRLTIDQGTTLLDLLREQMHLTGTKKGCDLGQCGACTVHIDGERALSCLTFAAMQNGRKVTTIEGLGTTEKLHPLQEAFIRHDGLQCGYCTPGQIMSAISCIREGHAGTDPEIREYMSGNLCRCGAYPNIVRAISEVKQSGQKV